MRSLQLLVLAVLATAARAEYVAISWPTLGEKAFSCESTGSPAQCSASQTVTIDPGWTTTGEPELGTVSVSGYILAGTNSLTIRLDYTTNGELIAFNSSPDAFAFGFLNYEQKLAAPAPPGSYAEFDIIDPSYDTYFCGLGLAIGVSAPWPCAADGRLIQPIFGDTLSISIPIQQGFIRSLVFDVSVPVDITYSVENVQLFDASGLPLVVPEPSTLLLLASAAGLALLPRKRKAR